MDHANDVSAVVDREVDTLHVRAAAVVEHPNRKVLVDILRRDRTPFRVLIECEG